jgi:hypothetical protein
MLEPDRETGSVGVMVRIAAITVLTVLVMGPASIAQAQQTQPAIRLAQAAPPNTPPRRVYRPQTRLRVTPNDGYDTIYPHYNPGPNAVRVCNAHYEQEYRPSGTVIVPKMHCYWTNDPRARAIAD